MFKCSVRFASTCHILVVCVYRVTRVHTKRLYNRSTAKSVGAARMTRVKISRKETPGRRVETLCSEKRQIEKKSEKEQRGGEENKTRGER